MDTNMLELINSLKYNFDKANERLEEILQIIFNDRSMFKTKTKEK